MEEIKLLKVLKNNARISLKDLSMILDEEENVIENKIRDLVDRKIISGFHTVINWDKTNNEEVMAMITVDATPERESGYDRIAKHIYSYDEVSTCYLISGQTSFMVIIQGKTMREVADFVAQKLAPIQGVNGTVTQFVLKRYKEDGIILDEEVKIQERMLIMP